MGCFLGCFGSSKDQKRRKQQQRYKVIPRIQNPTSQTLVQADVTLVQSIKDSPFNSPPETRVKDQELLSVSTRKKVTFDTNVTTYEHNQVYDSTKSLLEKNDKGETLPKSRETLSQDDSDVANFGSHPPSYRYGNCIETDDDEIQDSDYEDEDTDDISDDEEDYDDDKEEGIIHEDVWCESIPIDKVGSNSNARDRSASVLNPVENLTQWKALKSKATITPSNVNHLKENSSLNANPFPSKKRNQGITVDASLSNWLGKSISPESTTTPVKNVEDRPILGTLTADEMKQFSGSSCTPRKSPSRSPDDMPIIGSVGSYWSHTDSGKSLSSTSLYKGIPNTTSKYREDKKVNWHNTPFETRLERALNRDAAEAK